jgi:hypothetical protein
MRKGMEDATMAAQATKVSADAALMNAKSAIESERAYLHVILTHDGVGMGYGGKASELPLDTAGQIAQRLSVQFTLKNFGKTPAVLKEFSHHLRHDTEEWPKLAEYTPDLTTKMPVVLGANDSLPDKIVSFASPTVTAAEHKSAFIGDTAIWFYGYAIYDDVFGREIEYRFRWKFSDIGPLRFDFHKEFVRTSLG